ncbi:uncharacterized protein pico isoform X4 [Epargyreus clarus]|uniref:uncharacterized protein pico isoform X4 n=1 Tax=Epargyreus clarus TaxID=520877 RepID=UPI003C2DE4FD
MKRMDRRDDSSDESEHSKLDESLGGLKELTEVILQGLVSMSSTNEGADSKAPEIAAPRIDTCRFSMANLEESPDVDLDAILGELCALDLEYDEEIARVSSDFPIANEGADAARQEKASLFSCDNDSAFSDTLSMLSTGSSASSNMSSKIKALSHLQSELHLEHKELPIERFQDEATRQKTEKIHKALERSMRDGDVKKLFMKAFTVDGSSKSLLIDDKMTCGCVARLLADKNHVTMDPKWAIVEHLTDLCMERVYEDHEKLIDNIMLWTRDSKNKILFAERADKTSLFETPERFLLPEDDSGWPSEQDEHSRRVIIDEFFAPCTGISVPSISGHPVPPMEGPLFLKTELKKWKRYYFVLRPSGLYYSPKEKVKTKELVCIATFETNEVYLGVNWRKKYKSPTDFCFAIKHPKLQQPKSLKYIKFLCAEDQRSLDRWINAMRIAKHGRQLLENYRSLVEDLTHEDLDHLAQARSCSISSIPTKTNAGTSSTAAPAQSASSNASVAVSETSSGRHSRASSSSSSGCLSDGGTASESAFDCEFPMGTIKRKPSMKPNIPLTWMTRQLKEMAENAIDGNDTGTLTRRPRNKDDSTLKRHTSDNADQADYSSNSSYVSASSGSPAHTEGTSSGFYETIASDYRKHVKASDNGTSHYDYATTYIHYPDNQTDVIVGDDLPPPPPPHETIEVAMYASTTSLDSLPPPPPPEDTPDFISDNLSATLPLPPPEHTIDSMPGRVHGIVSQLTAQQMEQAARAGQKQPPRVYESARNFRQQATLEKIVDSRHPCIYTDQGPYLQENGKYGDCITELQTKKITNGAPTVQKKVETAKSSSLKKVNFETPAQPETKKTKKISFNLDNTPSSPKKPPPPKRNESTKLSSPMKLIDSNCNPPRDFLKDLQRVMRKKWQVAEKCKLEPDITPHEVLGFREYPLLDEYKEASVSMWVQEHYGKIVPPPGQIYQNVYMQYSQEVGPRKDEPAPIKKRPPPAPPKRSESTQLSTQQTPQYVQIPVQPTQQSMSGHTYPQSGHQQQSSQPTQQLVAMLTTEFSELSIQPQPSRGHATAPPAVSGHLAAPVAAQAGPSTGIISLPSSTPAVKPNA